MSTAAGTAMLNSGLTVLSEEEELFRSSVREFAEGEVRPRVEHMEQAAKLDPDLIKQCFELGLMAIESPEEFQQIVVKRRGDEIVRLGDSLGLDYGLTHSCYDPLPDGRFALPR